MKCPTCTQPAWRNGFRMAALEGREVRQQIWKCSACFKQFTSRSFSPFARMRFPQRTLKLALQLHFERGMSCYTIANVLAERGEKVSHVSVYKWLKKYAHLREQFAKSAEVSATRAALLKYAAE